MPYLQYILKCWSKHSTYKFGEDTAYNPHVFPMSQLFASGGQSIGATSESVLPMNIQGWFPLGLTGLISLQYRGFSRVFSSTTIQKNQFFGSQTSLWSNFHIWELDMITGKTHSFDCMILTIWWCPYVESSLGLLKKGVCYDQHVLLTKLY